jgi:hypothetical protein
MTLGNSETSAAKPSQIEIDDCIMKLALRELDGKPAGSTVMISQCIGFKKMGLWWIFRVYGIRSALKQGWERFRRR